MDIGLPGGDGTMVMQRLHALPQLSGVPVIVLSGRDPLANREAALAAGAAAYLDETRHAGRAHRRRRAGARRDGRPGLTLARSTGSNGRQPVRPTGRAGLEARSW